MQQITLVGGVEMPVLGLGVYQTPSSDTERVVRQAIEVGYRSIDTAQYYGNEEGVGRAVRAVVAQGLDREDLFVTTKLRSSGYRAGLRAIDESLTALDIGAIDLMLIHWPQGRDTGTWRALEEAVSAGRLRAIGLSNFYGAELAEIMGCADLAPAVDQVEQHVLYQQRRLRRALEHNPTRLEAWGPLGRGGDSVVRHPVLTGIGRRHGASAAQVALAFQVATGVITIPKTVHRERMVENLAAADLVLSAEELERVAALDTGRCGGWPAHPEQDYDPVDYPFR